MPNTEPTWKGAEALRPLLRPIAELKPDPANANDHDERSYESIRKSYERFGQRKAVVLRGDVVFAGNGQLEGAKRLGWSHIAVVDLDDLGDDDARAFALADNRTAQLSSWKFEALNVQLKALDAKGIRPGDLGWTPAELKLVERKADRRGLQGATDPGALDPTVGEADSKTGAVYQLGKHQLLVGDSCDAGLVSGFVSGAAQLLTDPPYGVDVVGGDHSLAPKDRLLSGAGVVENDDLDVAQLTVFLRKALTNGIKALRAGGTVYVFGPPGRQSLSFGVVLTELGVWRHTIAWVKDSLVMSGRLDYHYQHENIFYGWVPGAAHVAPTGRDESTVWECPRPKRNEIHPTMKPVPLFERAMRNGTNVGDVVVDLFAGSGTALIAAHNTERIARVVEKSPHYADAIRRRWTAFAISAQIDPGPGALG